MAKDIHIGGLPCWLSGKESAGQEGDSSSVPQLGRSPAGGNWQPTPVFLPEKSHGQRSLAGHSAWHHKRVGHDLATKWQHTPVFFPEKSHGQRSLAGYSPWGRKRFGCDLVTKQQKQQ